CWGCCSTSAGRSSSGWSPADVPPEPEEIAMHRPFMATVAAVALAVTACSTTPAASGGSGGAAPGSPAKVTLQLQWVAQGQFAGYYAAADQGYYKDAGLDVTIKE